MKKKGTDSGQAAELLQKLQAAVLSSSQKREQKKKQDQDEIDFQNKIADLLQRVTDGKPESKKASAKKSKAEARTPKTETKSAKQAERPVQEPIEPEVPLAEPESTPNPERITEPSNSPAPQPEQTEQPSKATKPARKQKAEKANKSTRRLDRKETDEQAVNQPPLFPTPVEASPTVNDPIEEAAPAEEIFETSSAEEMTEPEKPIETEQPLPSQEAAYIEPKPSEPESTSAAPDPIQLLTAVFFSEPEHAENETPQAEASAQPEPEPIEPMVEAPIEKQPQKAPAVERTSVKKEPEKPTAITQEPKGQAPKKEATAPAPNQLIRQAPKPIPPKPLQSKPIQPPPQKASAIADTRHTSEHHFVLHHEPLVEKVKPSAPIHIHPISNQRDTMQEKKKVTPEKKENKPLAEQPSAAPAVKDPPAEPQSIVIQPHKAPPAQEPIVIKPRQGSRSSEPTKTEPESAVQAPQEPIVIAAKKEVPAPQSQPKAPAVRKEKPTAAKRPAAKKVSSGITLPHATTPPAVEATQPAPPPKKAPLKKPAEKRSAVSLPHKPRRKPLHINQTPIASLPEDEHLDEALDEIVQDEITHELLPMEEPEVLTPVVEKKTSIFSRRKEKKAKQEEQVLGAMTLIEKKTGMTEDDIAMIFELGYENELGRLVGYETLKKLKFDHIRKRTHTDDKHYRTALGYRNAEYTGNQAREGILAAYAQDKKKLLLRLVLTAVIALLLLPIDLPELFGEWLAPYTAAYPFLLPLVFPLAGGLLLCLAAALSYKQLIAGICSLFRFTPTPYSLNAILVPLSLVCGMLSLFLSDAAVPANLTAVCSLLLCTVCDAYRLSDEMRSFRIASAEGEKYVLDAAEPRKKKLRYGDRIVKIINDDVDQKLYRVRKSHQISGFYRRNNDFSDAARPYSVLIGILLISTLIGALIGAVRTDSFAGAMSACMVTLSFAAPTASLLLFFYPLTFANRQLAHCNCTLLGEGSVQEYSTPKTVIFRDSDMYAAQKCTQISVRDGEDFREDMRLAGILFRKMSGTLGMVGQNAPMKNTTDPAVAFVRMTENGTEAVVDGHHLLAGNAAFLTKSGVRIPRQSSDQVLRRAANASLMYVAINGTLKLSYEIEYTVSASFEEMVHLLADADTTVAIQTYDPNLNEEFLQSGRREDAAYVRVIKPGRYEQDSTLDVSDTGVVALGRICDISRPLLAASAVRRIHRYGFRMLYAASLLGAALSVPVILQLEAMAPYAAVLLALGFRAICVALSWLLTRLTLRTTSLRTALPESPTQENHLER